MAQADTTVVLSAREDPGEVPRHPRGVRDTGDHTAGPTHLHDPAQVAVSRQLQALLLGPGLHVPELLAKDGAPVVGAEARLGVGHQAVEQPHVDEVEELGEELDSQRGVDPAATQQGHGARERVQHVVCEGRGLTVSAQGLPPSARHLPVQPHAGVHHTDGEPQQGPQGESCSCMEHKGVPHTSRTSRGF